MTDTRYQFADADGSLDWTPGNQDFDKIWPNAVEWLRFHQGEQFLIKPRGHAAIGQFHLWAVKDKLSSMLAATRADAIIDVISVKDSYDLAFRRHEMPMSKAETLIEDVAGQKGVTYDLGGEDPGVRFDCSGLVRWGCQQVGVVPVLGAIHTALSISQDSRVKRIPGSTAEARKKIKMGDIIFHKNFAHCSFYLDDQFGGRVWNTQPSNTKGPAGWPGVYVGVGVQIAPMATGWYCDWENIDWIGRVVSINGAL